MSLVYQGQHRYVKYGGRLDYCMFCAQDMMVHDGVSYGEAVIKVRGELSGRKVIRFRRSGADITICPDHIKDMYESLVEETAFDDEVLGEVEAVEESDK